MSDTRIERDSMGEVAVPADALYGAQTQRAVQNFPVSGQRMPAGFVRALLVVKAAAARANVKIGQLPSELGQAIDIHGDVRHAFPGPARLADLQGFAGLFDRKVENLRALGVEAIDGRLDGAWLRSLPRAQALEELKQLQGIGDFSAELVLLRGAGDPDHLPEHEPRRSTSPSSAAWPTRSPRRPTPPSPSRSGTSCSRGRCWRWWCSTGTCRSRSSARP